MMSKPIHELTLKELSTAIQAKQLSPVEITQAYLARMKKYNEQLNAYTHIDEETSLQQAKTAEETIMRGEGHMLTGVPLGHKDIFTTKCMPTTCGSKMLENFYATYDATVIKKTQGIGMPTLGKLNMDEFAMGSANENSAWGRVANPWNLDHCPGGSSGGSAAAVAARIAPAATGTDTGGSIRQPAAFTGITGIKPTYGRVSRYGMIAFASSLDQAGPMTQTAYDSALLLNTMCGKDPNDATSSNLHVPDFTENINDSISGLKIGLPEEPPSVTPCPFSVSTHLTLQ